MTREVIKREAMKKEAINRMRLLELHDAAIDLFEAADMVHVSGAGGILSVADEEQQHFISSFEEEHEVLVYHLIYTQTLIGDYLSFLFISNSEEEWEFDREDFKDGYIFSYVMNLSDDVLSEFGSIGIVSFNGGIKRTA